MARDIQIPPLGESIREAVIAKWLKEVGDEAAADEAVAELETDKVTVELRAPAAGVLAERRFPEGATVHIGDVVATIEPREAAAAPRSSGVAAATAAPPSPGVAAAPAAAGSLAVASPAVARSSTAVAAPASPADGRPLTPSQRRAMREHGGATPSGTNGAGATAAGPASSPSRATPAAPPAKSPVASPARQPAAGGEADEQLVPMSPLRRRIADRLVQAQHATASLTTFNEVDMSAVMALRERFRDGFTERHGVKLGFMSFFIKAAIASLEDYPGLNAEVRGDAIAYKRRYHVGVAVGSGKGLVVPVIRDADRLTFAELEAAIVAYGRKAQEGKLTVDDLSGGTFTISNGGVYGSMMSTPLLNYPQTGILGMHNIVKRAVVVGDRVEVRPMMYLAVTYDHRVVDGREAVQFLVGIKQRIESPERLLFAL